MPTRVGRSEEIQATVYQKTQVSANSKEDVWGLTPAQCRKVKEVGQGFALKLTTEAPVNGGRNYNGPKVAKFLVG